MTAPAAYEVVARNLDPAADNRIHDDDVAQRFGFAGALVPGVEVFAYLTSPLVAAWGEAWLAGGAVSVRFRRPVYDGERIVVRAEQAGSASYDLAVVGPDGSVRATGSAQPPGAQPAPDLQRYPETPLPGVLRPPRGDALPDGPLGTVVETGTRDGNDAYCDMVSEPLALYRDGVVHPGLLLRLVNAALMRNVALGPWIHTESSCRLLGVARVPGTLAVRSTVTGRSTRKGNDYVHYDALVLADGLPVMEVAHTAIYALADGP